MIQTSNIDAEHCILGSLLRNPDQWGPVSERLAADDFSAHKNRLIYTAIADLSADNQPHDIVTVSDQLGDRLAEAGGLGYLGEIVMSTAASDVTHYVDIVKTKSTVRRALAALGDAISEIHGGADVHETMATLNATVGALSEESRTSTDWPATVNAAMDVIDEAAEATGNGGIIGAPTGLPILDRRLQGIHGENLIIVAGRPSLGKTALVLQWALFATAKDYRIGFCSLETSTEIIGARSFAHDAQANITDLVNGEESAVSKIPGILGKTLKRKLWVNDLAYSLSGVVAQITAWKREHGIDYAIVDHVGLVETDKYETKNNQVGEVTRTLKKLTKQLGIPIVVVCQLNRTVERDKRRPKLADLRDSGSVEQDADVVLMIHSNSDGSEEFIPVELGFTKIRLGRKGWMDCFTFQGSTQTFREIEQQRGGFVRAV